MDAMNVHSHTQVYRSREERSERDAEVTGEKSCVAACAEYQKQVVSVNLLPYVS